MCVSRWLCPLSREDCPCCWGGEDREAESGENERDGEGVEEKGGWGFLVAERKRRDSCEVRIVKSWERLRREWDGPRC